MQEVRLVATNYGIVEVLTDNQMVVSDYFFPATYCDSSDLAKYSCRIHHY
jgi:hypothetical protein